MTIPDELVQAAAEVFCWHARMPNPCENCLCGARNALYRVFAKLPECEAAERTLNQAHCLNRESPCGHTRCALAALAREFGTNA